MAAQKGSGLEKGSGFDLETASLEEMEEFRQLLDTKIAVLRSERRESVLGQVRELLASIGETPETVFSSGVGRAPRSAASRPERAGGKVGAKYRDPETGQSWTGRGKQPVWLREKLAAGASLEDFAV